MDPPRTRKIIKKHLLSSLRQLSYDAKPKKTHKLYSQDYVDFKYQLAGQVKGEKQVEALLDGLHRDCYSVHLKIRQDRIQRIFQGNFFSLQEQEAFLGVVKNKKGFETERIVDSLLQRVPPE